MTPDNDTPLPRTINVDLWEITSEGLILTEVSISLHVFFSVIRSIETIGDEMTAAVAALGSFQAADGLGSLQMIGNQVAIEKIFLLIDAIQDKAKDLFPNKADRTEYVLQLTYDMLRDRTIIDRSEAAEIASTLLEKTFTSDAWRKRLDAYIDTHGLPKIDLPTGRRKKPEKA